VGPTERHRHGRVHPGNAGRAGWGCSAGEESGRPRPQSNKGLSAGATKPHCLGTAAPGLGQRGSVRDQCAVPPYRRPAGTPAASRGRLRLSWELGRWTGDRGNLRGQQRCSWQRLGRRARVHRVQQRGGGGNRTEEGGQGEGFQGEEMGLVGGGAPGEGCGAQRAPSRSLSHSQSSLLDPSHGHTQGHVQAQSHSGGRSAHGEVHLGQGEGQGHLGAGDSAGQGPNGSHIPGVGGGGVSEGGHGGPEGEGGVRAVMGRGGFGQ